MGEVTYIDEHRKLNNDKTDETSSAIHCLLVNINGEKILLPNAAVAEVANYTEPEVVRDAPEWLLGLVNWRERRIPLVSFEKLSQGNYAYPGVGERIVICNSLNGNRNVPYVGIVAQGIPHLLSLNEKDMTETAELTAAERQCIAMSIQLAEGSAFIPNLDDIEARIQTLQS